MTLRESCEYKRLILKAGGNVKVRGQRKTTDTPVGRLHNLKVVPFMYLSYKFEAASSSPSSSMN